MSRVIIHLRVLANPKIGIEAMLQAIRDIYEPMGLVVDVRSVQSLALPELISIELGGSCTPGSISKQQAELYGYREGVAPGEIAAYCVETIIPPHNGCAAFLVGEPSLLLDSLATQWTLAHEIGHVLGLRHVNDPHRLMTGAGTQYIQQPPPILTAGEILTMKSSRYCFE
jgi:hypothetical protein